MSAFTRTNSGLSNLCLFHSVDIVVFTEGGNRSLSVGDVVKGVANKAPVDTRFWQLVFDRNGIRKSYALKPIGSKSAVLKIATKIQAGEVSNVAATMDRDLDDFFGGGPRSPLIVYTRGCSWEADVFTKELTKRQVSSLLLTESLDPVVEREIDAAYDSFEASGARIARVEVMFRAQGVAWISDARGELLFRPERAGILDRKNLRKLITGKKAQLHRPVFCPVPSGVRVDPYLTNCGKLLRALSVAVLRYLAKKYGDVTSLQNGLIASAMLEKFGSSDDHVRSRYYSRAVSRLNAALS